MPRGATLSGKTSEAVTARSVSDEAVPICSGGDCFADVRSDGIDVISSFGNHANGQHDNYER